MESLSVLYMEKTEMMQLYGCRLQKVSTSESDDCISVSTEAFLWIVHAENNSHSSH